MIELSEDSWQMLERYVDRFGGRGVTIQEGWAYSQQIHAYTQKKTVDAI